VGSAALAATLVAFCFFLVLAPRPDPDPRVSPDARRFVAGLFFAIALAVAGGLLRPWRWPVLAARLLAALVLLPMVAVGPAGREPCVYAGDAAFAALALILAFGVVRAGPPPPPRDWPRWAMPRRWRRLAEEAERRTRR
jgi:hypothetical protein